MNRVHVCFPFTDPCPGVMAAAMIESVKRHMPDSIIVQLTDRETAELPGVDDCLRLSKNADFIEWRLSMMMELTYQRILFLDYDVILQHDLSAVFAQYHFDIALTKRDSTDKTISAEILARCPHNLGVAFSHGYARDFWCDAKAIYLEQQNQDGWLDGQVAIETALARTKHSVLSLPCSRYNYTPLTQDEDVTGRYAVHYKGGRKMWVVGLSAYEAAKDVSQRVGINA